MIKKRKAPRKLVSIHARADKDDLLALDAITWRLGITRSEAIRLIVHQIAQSEDGEILSRCTLGQLALTVSWLKDILTKLEGKTQ